MSQHDIRSAERPDPDQVLVDIADYVCDYEIDSALLVTPGTVFLARSRSSSVLCSFLGSLARYGKFHVLDIDTGNRSVTLELLVDLNCGFRGLEPGIPTS